MRALEHHLEGDLLGLGAWCMNARNPAFGFGYLNRIGRFGGRLSNSPQAAEKEA